MTDRYVLRLIAVGLTCCLAVGAVLGLSWQWLAATIDRAFTGIVL